VEGGASAQPVCDLGLQFLARERARVGHAGLPENLEQMVSISRAARKVGGSSRAIRSPSGVLGFELCGFPRHLGVVLPSGVLERMTVDPLMPAQAGFSSLAVVFSQAIDFLQTYNGAVTAFATCFIAVFTIVLAYVTRRQAILTRQSVRISERALTDLERPYLFILDYNWLLIDRKDRESGLVYSVANGGKLPAFIKSVKVGMRFGESIPLVDDQPPVHDLLTAPLIRGGEQRQIIQGFRDESGEPARECQIRGGIALIPGTAFKSGRVIAKISIEYDGPMTTGHVTTACWEWHPVKYAFTQYGGPEHNQRT
jgi:hypothetical protein